MNLYMNLAPLLGIVTIGRWNWAFYIGGWILIPVHTVRQYNYDHNHNRWDHFKISQTTPTRRHLPTRLQYCAILLRCLVHLMVSPFCCLSPHFRQGPVPTLLPKLLRWPGNSLWSSVALNLSSLPHFATFLTHPKGPATAYSPVKLCR